METIKTPGDLDNLAPYYEQQLINRSGANDSYSLFNFLQIFGAFMKCVEVLDEWKSCELNITVSLQCTMKIKRPNLPPANF